jgi:hypothetical protein
MIQNFYIMLRKESENANPDLCLRSLTVHQGPIFKFSHSSLIVIHSREGHNCAFVLTGTGIWRDISEQNVKSASNLAAAGLLRWRRCMIIQSCLLNISSF